MTRLRFALLNAAHDGANTRRNFRREVDADLVEFSASDGHLPDHTPSSTASWSPGRARRSIGTKSGSRRSSTTSPRPPTPASRCSASVTNHQVLAEALDGRVAGMDGFEIGYNEVRHRSDDELFAGVDEEFTVFTTHGDAVVDLPPNASLIGENDHGVHAFRDGCWGVQFHPEYDLKTAREEVTRGNASGSATPASTRC